MPKLNATVNQLELNVNKVQDFDINETYDNDLYPSVNAIKTHLENTNQSITLLDDKLIDYIVEQKILTEKDGGWIYRKWYSGVAECWGTLNKESDLIGEGNSTMPLDTKYVKLAKSFPSNLFTDTPIVIVTAIDSGTGVCTADVDLDTTKDTCTVFEWGRVEAFGNVNIAAIGRWK